MANEELIKRLQDFAAGTMRDEDAKLAFEAISALSRDRWISVEERLPKVGVYVLCACRADIYCVMKWDGVDWYENPTHIYMRGFVTHWMPLPEPPKEET